MYNYKSRILWAIALFFLCTTNVANTLAQPTTALHRLYQEADALDNSPYMNTKFLSQYDKAAQQLIERDGFENVFFTSRDGLKINGLLRTTSTARATIIIVAGWWPGRKEGVASLVPMIPKEQYNILLVDTRYHGKSEGGSLLYNVGLIGLHEYKDIIGAIEYLHQTTKKPIILCGTCAGAHHAAHALIKLEQEKKIHELGVKGLVFDSGWGSVVQASMETINQYSKEKTSKKFLQIPLMLILRSLRYVWTEKQFIKHESQTNLYDKIDQISVPIFYIHARNDKRAEFAHVEQLYNKTQNKQCWWIEKSKHACNHLKYKHEYRYRLLDFCNQLTIPRYTHPKG